MTVNIKNIFGAEIKDSIGRPTLKIVMSSDGHTAEALVPSGQSRGSREAFELRDDDGGIKVALEVLEKVIKPAIVGRRLEQNDLDNFLLALDGTPNKSKLGGNTLIGTSMAAARLIAKERGVPLWESIASECNQTPEMPMLFMNIINGGVHADFRLPFQEHMVLLKKESIRTSFELGEDIFARLGEIIESKYEKVPLGDEGGYSPRCTSIEEPFELLIEAAGGGVSLAIDVAATELFKDGKYELYDKRYSSRELLDIYRSLISKFPIQSLEDPFEESNIDDFKKIVSELGENVSIVGDDLTVTNPVRIREIADQKAANAVIIKPNQIGTISETLEATGLAKEAGWKTIVSHRSGDTKDDFIADLAVGIGAYGIKAGSPGPVERRTKYQRLMKIEEQEMVK